MLERARSMASDVPNVLGALGQAYALAGRTADARNCLERLDNMSRQGRVPSSCLAIVHLGLGENHKALDYLLAACRQRELSLMVLKVHPVYDPLRSEPEFKELLKKIGLA
jgi:hypothetical protein